MVNKKDVTKPPVDIVSVFSRLEAENKQLRSKIIQLREIVCLEDIPYQKMQKILKFIDTELLERGDYNG